MNIKSISWIFLLSLLLLNNKVNGLKRNKSNHLKKGKFNNNFNVVYDIGNANHVPFDDTSSIVNDKERDSEIKNDDEDEDEDDRYLRTFKRSELYNIENIYNNKYHNPIYYLNRVNRFLKRSTDDTSQENTKDEFFNFGDQLDGFSLFVYESLIDMAFSSTKGVTLSQHYKYGINFFESVDDSDAAILISSGYSAFTYDYPEVWWHKKIGFSICKDTNNKISSVAFQIVSDLEAEQITKMTTRLDYEIDKIVKEAPKTSDYDNLKYLHDTIATKVEYNMNAEHRYSVYGSLVQHQSVCEGYGESLKLLARKFGIDVICVPSTEHLWNMVKLDGQWYTVDITFDDPRTSDSKGNVIHPSGDSSNIIYSYFLRGKDFMENYKKAKESHTINKSLTYVKGTKEFEFPELADVSYITQYEKDHGVALIAASLMSDATSLKISILSIIVTTFLSLLILL